MADDFTRIRATEYVLGRYHLTTLQEAQERLTPTQFEGLMGEIAGVQAQLTTRAQPQPALPAETGSRGIMTPFGPILPVTGLLLVVIWIIFAIENAMGGSTSESVLTLMGATTVDMLATGQYWRLLAACFLHIGPAHIITNSISLIVLGGLAERFYGPLRYLGIYLAAGVGGNIAVGLLQPGPGAGASGAIFGLLGAILVGAVRNRRVIGSALQRQIVGSLGTMLVLNIGISFLPGISAYAHFGGLAIGAALALLIPFRSPRYPRAYAAAANGVSAILVVASLALILTWIGNHAPQ